MVAPKVTIVMACAVFLAAGCGGGGGGGGGSAPPPVNQAPTANAGADQSVIAGESVALSGSGTDPEGSTLTYSWTQTAGPDAGISGANGAQATVTVPSAAPGTVLTFELTVTDSGGEADSDSVSLTITDAPGSVTISGKVQFEFVPRGPVGDGLDYDSIEVRPIRGATVQAVSGAGTVLAETTSNPTGDYALEVPGATDVRIRVRAELKRSGAPGWDVEVRDNTSNTGVALSSRPIYVLDGPLDSSGTADSTRNLLAGSGWSAASQSYAEARAAAPFAVLDTIYRAMELVTGVDPDAQFPPLDAFWSVNNRPVDGDIDLGEIGTSFYRGDIDSLFLLGAENEDTEEYDTHVVAHEWGHYFEDTFSRSDSVGGRWSDRAELDPRLAFGEGWGNAVAGMIMDDPVYFDTLSFRQGQSFAIDVDGRSNPPPGWFSAGSVQEILWDLFDAANPEAEEDGVSLGFGPLYQTLVNEQRQTPAFTTIFSFIHELKQNSPGQSGGIDALVEVQRIDPIGDIWGDGEQTNNAGRPDLDLIPIYPELTLGAGPIEVCVTTEFDPDGDGNRLGNSRYLRFSVAADGNYRITVTTTTVPSEDDQFSDPDFFVFREGFSPGDGSWLGATGTRNSEELDITSLSSGTYVVDVVEAGFENPYGFASGSAALTQSEMCFDVSLSQF